MIIRRSRRWLLFGFGGLGALLLTVTLLYLRFGSWIAEEREKAANEKEVADSLVEQGAHFGYGLDDLPNRTRSGLTKAILGDDVWGKTTHIHFSFTDIGDDGMVQLKNFPHVKYLWAGPKTTDAGLTHLSTLQNLEFLDLCQTQVTDQGLINITSLPMLRTLYLDETDITDAGLEQLHTCAHLSELRVRKTKVTITGVEKFRKALPHTEVPFP